MSLSQEPSPDMEMAPEPASGRPRWPMRFSGCAVILAALALLLGLLVSLFPAYVRHKVFAEIGPSYADEVKRFADERLDFPKEWTEVKPFAPEFSREVEKLRAMWQKRDPKADALLNSIDRAPGGKKGPSPEEISTSKTLWVAYLRPQLEQLRRTVACEGYDLEAFDATQDWQIAIYPYWDNIIHLQVYDIESCARSGNYDQTLSNTLVLLRSLKRNPACSYWTHSTAEWAIDQTMEQLTTAALATTQSAMLVQALNEMNRLDPLVNLNVMEKYTQLLCSLGGLRAMKREGYPLVITPGNPACTYAYQLKKAEREFPAWMLQRLPPADTRRPAFEDALLRAIPKRSWDSWKAIRSNYYDFEAYVSPERFYSICDISASINTVPWEKSSKARYDLTRLLLAQRLVELSGETTSGSMEALVPKYLPQVPVCPFSGAPYLWDASRGRFYSVGPNKRDDKGTPCDRSMTSGDVIVP